MIFFSNFFKENMISLIQETDYIQLLRNKIMTIILCGKFLKGKKVCLDERRLVFVTVYVGH